MDNRSSVVCLRVSVVLEDVEAENSLIKLVLGAVRRLFGFGKVSSIGLLLVIDVEFFTGIEVVVSV